LPTEILHLHITLALGQKLVACYGHRKSTMDSADDGIPGFLLSAYSSPIGLVHPAQSTCC